MRSEPGQFCEDGILIPSVFNRREGAENKDERQHNPKGDFGAETVAKKKGSRWEKGYFGKPGWELFVE
jgi:hypothetical protein